MPLIILTAQTLFFWLVVLFLYRMKSKFTLIPIYSYLAVLTVAMHNISDFGFAVIQGDWFFLVGSVSFFTTLMFIVLFLYLFEGPRAARIALGVILGASFFYIFVIYTLQFIVDTSDLVQLSSVTAKTYFWSILAIIIDVFLLTIFWELVSKIKSLYLLIRVFVVFFAVLIIDTLIFTTGVFVGTDFYTSILTGNLLVRFILAVLSAPVITLLLRSSGFMELKRSKPQNFWEILNFRSDLEAKISTLEETIKKNKSLEEKLQLATETYELAITGSGSGLWDWNMLNNQVVFSDRFRQMLGYKSGELKNNVEAIKAILHPHDLKKHEHSLQSAIAKDANYEGEYRLKSKSGKYKWFAANGVIKYNQKHQPVRMVGSIIDIDAKKQNEMKIKEKIEELSSLNNFMVNRELKMIELKNKIRDLENKNIKP